MTPENQKALKRGQWLLDDSGNIWEYVGRRKNPPGVVMLRDLGHRTCLNKRGHRPTLDFPTAFLDLLEPFL